MKRIRRPSPGIVVALVALFFALGGSAIAAHHYLITSTGQIKPGAIIVAGDKIPRRYAR